MVDEAGLRFSGGERHRLALARILLKDAPIIILDEPTVGLDPITERALQEHKAELMPYLAKKEQMTAADMEAVKQLVRIICALTLR